MSEDAAGRRTAALAFALSLPGAWEDHPWAERVVKVGKKVFVFGGLDDWHEGPMLTLKLASSQPMALGQPGIVAAGYGLGRAGWVTVRLRECELPLPVLRDWTLESYRAVAPKKLVAELDAARSTLRG